LTISATQPNTALLLVLHFPKDSFVIVVCLALGEARGAADLSVGAAKLCPAARSGQAFIDYFSGHQSLAKAPVVC
jgi:hypothetical protein